MAILINGNGNEAIYAQQDADWYAALMGGVTMITAVGQQFAYELLDANTIGVKDGVIITKEGRRIQVDTNVIDTFDIPTGAQGTTNYYIIGYHLVTDEQSVQSAETFVQLMENGTDTIPEGSFKEGDDDVYVSLYRVEQNDLTIGTITLLLPTVSDSMQQQITQISNDLESISYNKVSSIEQATHANLGVNDNQMFIDGIRSNGTYRRLLFDKTNGYVEEYDGTSWTTYGLIPFAKNTVTYTQSDYPSYFDNCANSWVTIMRYGSLRIINAYFDTDPQTANGDFIIMGIINNQDKPSGNVELAVVCSGLESVPDNEPVGRFFFNSSTNLWYIWRPCPNTYRTGIYVSGCYLV